MEKLTKKHVEIFDAKIILQSSHNPDTFVFETKENYCGVVEDGKLIGKGWVASHSTDDEKYIMYGLNGIIINSYYEDFSGFIICILGDEDKIECFGNDSSLKWISTSAGEYSLISRNQYIRFDLIGGEYFGGQWEGMNVFPIQTLPENLIFYGRYTDVVLPEGYIHGNNNWLVYEGIICVKNTKTGKFGFWDLKDNKMYKRASFREIRFPQYWGFDCSLKGKDFHELKLPKSLR